VLKFTLPVSGNSIGGLLLDDRERVLELSLRFRKPGNQSYAVPMSSVIGLARSIAQSPQPGQNYSTFGAPATSTTPVPIPQSSVVVPQRPVLALEARGPGSVVVKPLRTGRCPACFQDDLCKDRHRFFWPEHLVNALKKRAENGSVGTPVRCDPRVADLVLTRGSRGADLEIHFFAGASTYRSDCRDRQRDRLERQSGRGKDASRVIERLKAVRAEATPKTEPKREKEKNQKDNKKNS